MRIRIAGLFLLLSSAVGAQSPMPGAFINPPTDDNDDEVVLPTAGAAPVPTRAEAKAAAKK